MRARQALATLFGLELLGGLFLTFLFQAVAGMGALAADNQRDTEAAERAEFWLPLVAVSPALLMLAAIIIAWQGVRGPSFLRAGQRLLLVLVLGLHGLGFFMVVAHELTPLTDDLGKVVRVGLSAFVVGLGTLGSLWLLLEPSGDSQIV